MLRRSFLQALVAFGLAPLCAPRGEPGVAAGPGPRVPVAKRPYVDPGRDCERVWGSFRPGFHHPAKAVVWRSTWRRPGRGSMEFLLASEHREWPLDRWAEELVWLEQRAGVGSIEWVVDDDPRTVQYLRSRGLNAVLAHGAAAL